MAASPGAVAAAVICSLTVVAGMLWYYLWRQSHHSSSKYSEEAGTAAPGVSTKAEKRITRTEMRATIRQANKQAQHFKQRSSLDILDRSARGSFADRATVELGPEGEKQGAAPATTGVPEASAPRFDRRDSSTSVVSTLQRALLLNRFEDSSDPAPLLTPALKDAVGLPLPFASILGVGKPLTNPPPFVPKGLLREEGSASQVQPSLPPPTSRTTAEPAFRPPPIRDPLPQKRQSPRRTTPGSESVVQSAPPVVAVDGERKPRPSADFQQMLYAEPAEPRLAPALAQLATAASCASSLGADVVLMYDETSAEGHLLDARSQTTLDDHDVVSIYSDHDDAAPSSAAREEMPVPASVVVPPARVSRQASRSSVASSVVFRLHPDRGVEASDA